MPTQSVIEDSGLRTEQQHDNVDVNLGPVTRSPAKNIQQEVNSLLTSLCFNYNENVILPKCCTLLLLDCTPEEMGHVKTKMDYTKARCTVLDTAM